MLKYKVKLGIDNFKQSELEWSEKYLAPDLSFVSGVTDTSYHLEKFKLLPTRSSIVNSNSLVSVDAHNAVRQGFVVAKGKKFRVHSSFTYDYSVDKSGETIDYKYVEINGKYFYASMAETNLDMTNVPIAETNPNLSNETAEWGSNPTSELNTRKYFFIDNLLNYSKDTSAITENVVAEIKTSSKGDYISVDTVYWIEDGKVFIDGNEYIFDKNENGGVIKFLDDGKALDASAITECDKFDFHPYEPNDYKEVTKFSLTKQQEIKETFSKISFCKYYYYIKYKNHYCQIKCNISGNGVSYKFVCEIPLYVISGGTLDNDNLKPKEYDVYFANDFGYNDPQDSYREAKSSGYTIDSDHYELHGVKLLNELKDAMAFVYVDEDDAYFKVEHDVVNANDGNEVIIYLDNVYSPLKVGDNIELTDTSKGGHKSFVYNSESYSGQNENFILFNGQKYLVQENICDKVVINDNEYDIDYINGKVENADCLVSIADEKVPMKIIKEMDEDDDPVENDNYKLKRYGLIVSGISGATIEAEYPINQYDGIIINNKKYIIHNESIEDDTKLLYSYIDLSNKYTFIISEIIGNSTYICKPFINNTDFTNDFNRFISERICEDVVQNQNIFDLKIKNKVFGEFNITEDLAFRATNTPKSSDDFYNLFEDLKIYVNSGYIHIPLTLGNDEANNMQQEDIVNRDFFNVEKEKAINPIVDMEKDVYVPKFMDGKYSGVDTVFKPIYKINLNFHFRTRDEAWKVNEGYNKLRYSADTKNQSVDNWFVTDFYPYRQILNDATSDNHLDELVKLADTLQETSDLMGLLHFTNDDIFYQKSRVANSFARLSFYDSTDPQTQSLLATSCIFVDEHSLFKKFIDNSRKNIYEYGQYEEPKYSADTTTDFIINNALSNNEKIDITTLHKSNKISVKTEFLGRKKGEGVKYKELKDSSGITIDENHRISSRLVVENKYVTNTSSEGFYLYIFREYAENLHPKPIYMKVEFNHAGIGKILPFLVPMHWSGNTTNANDKNYNKMYPCTALKMSNIGDLDELKKGIPLSYVYAQTYIPLYAVYDFKNKEYCYVFDDRYVKVDEEGTLNLNLFELKIMNESDEEVDDEDLKDIKLNRQRRAIINVNEGQFDKEAFNYNVE